MTDHSLARADEVLTELTELVETARTLPMSSSCVLPRERTLDLLDALREVLPTDMIEARRIVAEREDILAGARTEADEALVQARSEADEHLRAARIEAHELLEAARQEQGQLVAAATVHQVATETAGRLRAEAEAELAEQRASATTEAERLREEAARYAEQTLSELIDTLHRMAGTAENGRAALLRRRAGED
ncbi:hypothetical protein M6D93_08180 [Jatrophihabitans telluris]|uniref:ATP synthase F0 subunit B n=1 Tax=Jatrophihabitans telluris TaxID=2038343 RepID=A0ABY4R3K6_9ACTN|nr:hypothetical protein [Jatrophihabitans telluris]UQX89968.1 hypothetical protein M6D93_08180 [Jatrophihabitans telluris]